MSGIRCEVFYMANKMKEIRQSKGLGQKEIAAKLDMPVRTYGSYERGERSLSLDVAAEIADVLGVTIDQLLGREYYMSPSEEQRRYEFSRYRQSLREIDAKLNPERQMELSDKERRLVELYRQMDAQFRAMLLKSAEAYAGASVKEADVQSGAVSA